MRVIVCNVNALMSNTIRYGDYSKSHINQQRNMAVAEMVTTRFNIKSQKENKSKQSINVVIDKFTKERIIKLDLHTMELNVNLIVMGEELLCRLKQLLIDNLL